MIAIAIHISAAQLRCEAAPQIFMLLSSALTIRCHHKRMAEASAKEHAVIRIGRFPGQRKEKEQPAVTLLNLNSTNLNTYKIIRDQIKHLLQKSHKILKKMLAFLCEVYYNRDILQTKKQGFVWH